MSHHSGIILQARMGSSRLPGKSMLPFGNTTLIGYIVRRFAKVRCGLPLIIATTVTAGDDVLAGWAEAEGCKVFRGEEYNVLDRYLECACKFRFDPIVRLTGDNPFVDIPELYRLLQMFGEQQCDYITSHGNLPLGTGAEIFSLEALLRSHKLANKPEHFEHVNEYILQNQGTFKVGKYEAIPEKNFPEIRLTIDTSHDMERAMKLIEFDSDPSGSILPILRKCLHSA